MKKQITIDVPDGLPEGWECVGYGTPVGGETMHHVWGGWMLTEYSDYDCHGDACDYLIARRTETAADWANNQPKLGALASVLGDGCKLCLFRHAPSVLIDQTGSQVYIYAEKLHEKWFEVEIISKSGKWVNA